MDETGQLAEVFDIDAEGDEEDEDEDAQDENGGMEE